MGDLEAGLREMRRVTRGPVVIPTCDPGELGRFWLGLYAPEAIAVEAGRYPSIERMAKVLGAGTEASPVPIPLDCVDGFNETYDGRPERLLDPAARLACSAWSFVDPGAVARFETRLRDDLQSGDWDAQHGHLRAQPEFEGSLRLIVAMP